MKLNKQYREWLEEFTSEKTKFIFFSIIALAEITFLAAIPTSPDYWLYEVYFYLLWGAILGISLIYVFKSK